MPSVARTIQPTSVPHILLVAFELGAKDWKLGVTPGPSRTPRLRRIEAGNLAALERRMRLKPTRDLPERLREVRLWDGSELPGELRARLEREWVRRQRVTDEVDALEADRLERLRTVKEGAGGAGRDEDHLLCLRRACFARFSPTPRPTPSRRTCDGMASSKPETLAISIGASLSPLYVALNCLSVSCPATHLFS